MKYLLDTNIISEITKKQPNPKIINWIDTQNETDLYISVITIGEIKKGIEKIDQTNPFKKKLETWLQYDLYNRFQDRNIEINIDIILIWGNIIGKNEKKGEKFIIADKI